MVIVYLVTVLIILLLKIEDVPSIISLIFTDAFSGRSVLGGALGALIITGVLLLMVGFFIIKQIKFKQQKLIEANRLKDEIAKIKTQEQLNQERLRISRDLHDNIGSQLTFIISSIDNMSYFMKDTNNELKTKLQELNEFSRSAITELRGTINKLNKSK